MTLYQLPQIASIGGREYGLNTDFRQVLQILQCLEDASMPELLRWRVAMGLFYSSPVPREHWQEAMAYLADFLRCGQPEGSPGPKLLDWQQDAPAIISGVNAAAGCIDAALGTWIDAALSKCIFPRHDAQQFP